jgi:hypothetical protein
MTDPTSHRTDDADRQAAREDGPGAEARPVDWLSVVATLAEENMPAPPAALGWPKDWYPIDSHCFASWPAATAPYDFEPAVREAFEQAENQIGLLGFDGYGFNSWAMHAIWRRGRLLVGFQSAAGGAFTDADQSRERIEASWEVLSEMAELLTRQERAGKWPSGRTLVVIDSDLHEGRWAWLADGADWDAADWKIGWSAAMEALDALEAL